MSTPEFVLYPNPILSARAEPRPYVDDAMTAVGARMVEAARAVRAYGLAAAHLGEAMPVVVISADGVADKYFMLFNPRVVEVSAETEKGTEGSVSLPGALVEVDRPVWAQIEYVNADGTTHSTRFKGFAARIALHEIEQTQGIFFLDRVSRLKRDRALKKAAKAAR